MARALRLEFEDALYHLCARGNRRERIFADDKDCGRFLELTQQSLDRCRRKGVKSKHWTLGSWIWAGQEARFCSEGVFRSATSPAGLFRFDFRRGRESSIWLMKTFVAILLSAFALAPLCSFGADEKPEFPGLEKVMKAEDYEAAGLNKLTDEEKAKLDEFIRAYVSKKSEIAATAAVDEAVKESDAMAPKVIESRIVGPFTGYTGKTVFTLENGQKWMQSQPMSRYFGKIDSPMVVIVKGTVGYRMYIVGGGDIRVQQVK